MSGLMQHAAFWAQPALTNACLTPGTLAVDAPVSAAFMTETVSLDAFSAENAKGHEVASRNSVAFDARGFADDARAYLASRSSSGAAGSFGTSQGSGAGAAGAGGADGGNGAGRKKGPSPLEAFAQQQLTSPAYEWNLVNVFLRLAKDIESQRSGFPKHVNAEAPVTTLSTALRDPKQPPHLRIAAALSLGEHKGSAAALQALRPVLLDENEAMDLRSAAALALGQLGSHQSIRCLITALSGELHHVALYALCTTASPHLEAHLISALNYPDTRIAGTASMLLSIMGSEKGAHLRKIRVEQLEMQLLHLTGTTKCKKATSAHLIRELVLISGTDAIPSILRVIQNPPLGEEAKNARVRRPYINSVLDEFVKTASTIDDAAAIVCINAAIDAHFDLYSHGVYERVKWMRQLEGVSETAFRDALLRAARRESWSMQAIRLLVYEISRLCPVESHREAIKRDAETFLITKLRKLYVNPQHMRGRDVDLSFSIATVLGDIGSRRALPLLLGLVNHVDDHEVFIKAIQKIVASSATPPPSPAVMPTMPDEEDE